MINRYFTIFWIGTYYRIPHS